jgi:phosphoadenosine phosphosulfate reductase
MTLRELTLEGEVDKVAIAIKRLQTFEPADGYYLAFSGGKDSIVILDLAKRAGVKFDAHFHQCGGVDPPELIRFIRKHHAAVSFEMPKESMWELCRRKKLLPTRRQRFCCAVMKEGGGSGRMVMTGVRWEESVKRRGRRMVESCMKGGSKRYLHPIIDWSSDEVWEYIRENALSYCSLYDEGWRRVGCVMCPFSDIKGEAERWPAIAKQWRRVANAVWEANTTAKHHQFADGDAYYDWWITGRSSGNPDQLDLGVYE